MADFDVVVVGAGPAGSAAALVLARLGRSVALIERGPFPGSKNMYGGVVYGRVLDELIPGWWDEVPVQRWVTRRQTMVLTGSQSLSIDYRTEAWGKPPYNGCTTMRPDFDAWLAGKAEAAGATLLTSTTVTGLVTDARGAAVGVRTDRGDVGAGLVIACDGVNSFLAKEAGLFDERPQTAEHITLGVKEVLGFPRDVIDERFGVRGDHGVDIEILGCTGDVPGGGFVYTNAESVSVGVVLQLPGLKRAGKRPEAFIADLKAHPAIAPLVEGGDLKEYSAHLIPEGGYDHMPELAGDGILVAGDAAGLCLAAGIWLEGVNFAIGSGAAAGAVAHQALRSGDTTTAGLSAYRERLEGSFVLQDHRKLRKAPHLVLSHRVQQQYPQLACDMVEQLFTVDNPRKKKGGLAAARWTLRHSDVKLRDLARDAWTGIRSFG